MQETINELKALIASAIDLGGMDLSRLNEQTPLFGEGGLGLDSIDAMELLLLLEKKYGIVFENIHQGRQMLSSLGALAQYISTHRTK